MIINKDKSGENMFADIVQQMDNIDYVDDGEIVKNVPIKSVMVESSDDLTDLTGYSPGTIAFTTGFESVWQKSAAGTWTEIE